MADDGTPDHLGGKDERARRRIARRVGEQLSIERLPDAERLAGEALARELVGDAVELVRREFACAVRNAKTLPRDIAERIAHDVDSIACPFLETTEIFAENEWLQLIRTISLAARVTVARRADLSPGIALELARIGEAVVVQALVENPEAPLSEQVCHVIVERFDDHSAVLNALAERDDIGTRIALMLVEKVAASVRLKLERRYNLGEDAAPVVEETDAASLIAQIRKTPAPRLGAAVRAVNESGKLTPEFLIRALNADLLGFFGTVMSFLTDRRPGPGEALTLPADREPAVELFADAGIPASLHKRMWEALEEARARKEWNSSYGPQ